MTDETQLIIYGLTDMAERQQAELSAAIEALKAEREALRAGVEATVRRNHRRSTGRGQATRCRGVVYLAVGGDSLGMGGGAVAGCFCGHYATR